MIEKYIKNNLNLKKIKKIIKANFNAVQNRV
jgi:hypothetical protein